MTGWEHLQSSWRVSSMQGLVHNKSGPRKENWSSSDRIMSTQAPLMHLKSEGQPIIDRFHPEPLHGNGISQCEWSLGVFQQDYVPCHGPDRVQTLPLNSPDLSLPSMYGLCWRNQSNLELTGLKGSAANVLLPGIFRDSWCPCLDVSEFFWQQEGDLCNIRQVLMLWEIQVVKYYILLRFISALPLLKYISCNLYDVQVSNGQCKPQLIAAHLKNCCFCTFSPVSRKSV